MPSHGQGEAEKEFAEEAAGRMRLFRSGSKSGRFAAIPRSSSRILAGSLPETGWKPAGLKNVNLTVQQEKGLFFWLKHAYNLILSLRLAPFLAWAVAAPVLLAVLFTPLFMLNWRGLTVAEGYEDGWISSTTQGCLSAAAPSPSSPSGGSRWFSLEGARGAVACHCSHALHAFIFSLSLCTSFGGSPLSAVSPLVVSLANLLTLLAQLLFVFVSGTVFARISRPADNILAADNIILAYQLVPGYGPVPQRVLFTRVAVVGVNNPELVGVTFALELRIFLVNAHTGSFFIPVESLKLVRAEVPLLRFGFLVRHVVDESSPLFEYSDEDLQTGDASIMLVVNGMERHSMHPIFYKKQYFAFDNDILYDREFEDMLIIERGDQPFFDHAKLSLVKPQERMFED